MRRAARVDDNQHDLCDAWVRMGGTVLYLHTLGGGAPDTLLGMAGEMELVEIKSARGVLSQRQKDWRQWWQGRPPREARTIDDLVSLADEMRARASERKACYVVEDHPNR